MSLTKELVSLEDDNYCPNNDLDEFKKSMIRLLKEEQLHVVFTKRDGSERRLLCTLRDDLIEPYERKTNRIKHKNDNVISVWAINEGQWRSFRVDRVLGYSIQD